jgi:putative membrane protein
MWRFFPFRHGITLVLTPAVELGFKTLVVSILENKRALLKFAVGATLAIWLGAGQALAQTAAADPVGPALPTTAFVQAVASVDSFEQRAGKVAQVMGSSLEVRKFSRTMVDDHAKSAMTLADAISKAQIAAPAGDLSATQAGAVKDLYAIAPKDFDRTYMTGEVSSHQEALEAAQAYAAAGDNPAIKQIAAALVPVIQRHLDAARMILGHVR